MNHKKKKLKLSPAMKKGMMLILLEGESLEYHSGFPSMWRFASLNPITPRELLDGRKIPKFLGRATTVALLRRGLITKTIRYGHSLVGLTEKGLCKIRQWPEYGEIIAIKVAHEL